MKGSLSVVAVCLILTASVCIAQEHRTSRSKSEKAHEKTTEVGEEKSANASYYGNKSGSGSKTASGEPFNPNELTAAHNSYPFGTQLEVTNPDTNEKVNVRVNDRGPYVKGRTLDLSKGAAKKISLTKEGVTKVKVKVVKTPEPESGK